MGISRNLWLNWLSKNDEMIERGLHTEVWFKLESYREVWFYL